MPRTRARILKKWKKRDLRAVRTQPTLKLLSALGREKRKRTLLTRISKSVGAGAKRTAVANGRDAEQVGDAGIGEMNAGAPRTREVTTADGKVRIRVLEYVCPPPSLYERV